MSFDFSSDPKLLRKTAASMLKEHASFARVRKAMDAGEGIDRAL